MAGVAHIGPTERVDADPTPGIRREQAIATERLWAGLVTTQPGGASGWHHHGDHDTSIYVASGQVKLESGPGGTQVVIAGVGDFVHVSAWEVHRESNPSGAIASQLVVTRAGRGLPTINVDGPA
ncbi:MAG: cupin domain-containing protein [Actinomycetota bacterium]|nr:cupin domain-containing protein [Actinomycetota bacterium]